MEDILIGTTDRTILVFIPDPASTTGAGKTGLVAADLTVTYTRVETDNDVVHTDVTGSLNNLSALTDAHNDWGLKEVSATLSKGLYRLDLADAVFATGAWYAVVQVTITTGTAAATPKAFALVAVNKLDGVRLGLTALPNAAADAAGGLIISDAGGLDADAQRTDVTAIKGKTDNLPSDPADQSLVIAATDAIYNRLGAPAGASIAADIAAIDTGGGDGSTLTDIPWNPDWDPEVQSEVEDALAARFDASRPQRGQEAIPASASMMAKIDDLHKLARNKASEDTTTTKIFADDGVTVDHKGTNSWDGTTFVRGEIVSGP